MAQYYELMAQLYDGLSTFELISLIHSNLTLAIAFFSLFTTMLFAYLVMAYFAAKRLSRFQVTTISAIYSLAIFFTMIGIYDSTRNIDIIEQVIAGTSFTPSLVNIAFNVLLFVARAVSIMFFIQARRVNGHITIESKAT